MGVTSRLQSGPFDPAAELAAFLKGRTDDGAVVSFTGLARRTSHEGEAVSTLYLEHYPGMTERTIEEIAEAGAKRFGVSDVLVIHRCGEIEPGEAIVFVAAASRRRGEAFAAADYLMDRMKTEAAFWKREDGEGGSRWIEPTDLDRDRRAKWSE
jgi:molybdopterin synthase catalytic subunit